MASSRFNSLALANRRKASLAVDVNGKIIKTIEEDAGKVVLTSTTAATTTTVVTGSTKLTTGTDSGNIIVDLATTNLSIMGGRNITTKTSEGKIYLDLANNLSITQAVIQTPDSTSPLILKSSNGSVIFEVTSEGVGKLPVKAELPTSVTTGIVYASGLGRLPEGYYVGHLGLSDPLPEPNTGGESNPS